jgi:uncharacterized protein YbcV (DUF1398 family)
MFTLEQIKAAHAKVKSGADFPIYIQDLKNLGVRDYVTYVSDGHADYNGENGASVSSTAKYDLMPVAAVSDVELFKKYLKEHQEGGSDYLTFCEQSASVGVEKWVVDVGAMTCTYYDAKGNEILQEKIPG